jgi:hypothetical protein
LFIAGGVDVTTRSVIFTLAVLAAACTGSDFSSDPMDAGPDALASGGSAGSGAAGGGAGRAGSGGAAASSGSAGTGGTLDAGLDAEIDAELDAPDPDAADPDANTDAGELEGGDACTLVAYYFDGDGDGFGSTTTVTACTTPDGSWVTVGGDCDDGHPSVNPGQTSYFTVGYVKTGSSEISFDYDCSGLEKEAGSSPKAACQVQGLGCVGGGYVFATPVRSGPGVDPYCGSEQRVNCNYTNLKCPQSAPYDAPAIACR